MTPNSTCEVCWCLVLDKFRRRHEQYHEDRDEKPKNGWQW